MKRGIMPSILKVLSILLLILMVFAVIWLRSNVISLEYKISSLEKKKLHLTKEHKIANAEKARLLALERFEASETRGFGFPDRVRVLYVREPVNKEPYRITHSRRY